MSVPAAPNGATGKRKAKQVNQGRGAGIGNWSQIEDTALVLAGADATEQCREVADAARSKFAAGVFASHLDHAEKLCGMEFKERKVKDADGNHYLLTREKMVEYRTAECRQYSFMNRYKTEFVKYCDNVISVGYSSWPGFKKDGDVVSGKILHGEEHLRFIKEYIWKHEETEKIKTAAANARNKRRKEGATAGGSTADAVSARSTTTRTHCVPVRCSVPLLTAPSLPHTRTHPYPRTL